MSRIARIAGAAAVVAAALSVVPAQADQQQILCRRDRYIYTTDFTIKYPWFEICR